MSDEESRGKASGAIPLTEAEEDALRKSLGLPPPRGPVCVTGTCRRCGTYFDCYLEDIPAHACLNGEVR